MRFPTYQTVVGMSFGTIAISFVTSKTNIRTCTSHVGHAVGPSDLPAPNEAASRICTDVRLAQAWEGKVFRLSKDC